MEGNDDWLALDKIYHVLFCFTLTVLFSLLATRIRYPLIKSHSIWVGSIISLLAGTAKEVADELGYFRSAGASSKDAVADVFGTLLAAVVLSIFKSKSRVGRDPSAQALKALEMV